MILDGFSRKKVQRMLNLEICLESLKILSIELIKNQSRVEDFKRWETEINRLIILINKKDLVEKHLLETYELLFSIYKERHIED